MISVPNSAAMLALEALIAAKGLLDGAVVHLFANDVLPTDDSTVASFTEATFTGYSASAAIVWGTPYFDSTGAPVCAADSKQFTSGSPLTVSNTIYGYYVTDTAGTALLYAERFDSPVIVNAPSQAVVVLSTFGCVSQA